MRQPFQPANGASSATDAVQRTQILDTSGNVITSFGGASTTGTPADTFASPGAIPENMVFPMIWNGTTWDRLKGSSQDGATFGPGHLIVVPALNGNNTLRVPQTAGANDGGNRTFTGAASPMLWDGASVWQQRTPNVFKSFASTALTAGTGITVWTPAAGKKFRLMGYMISSSVAGVLIFGDNAVGTVILRSAAVAAAGIAQFGAADMGNGILSAAANNVLKLDGPTGNVAGVVFGCEE